MLKRLYEDIGDKIKRLAMLMFVIEAVFCVVIGVILIATSEQKVLGILLVGLGPLIAWISSWQLYGFGELIDKTCENERHNREILKIIEKIEQK